MGAERVRLTETCYFCILLTQNQVTKFTKRIILLSHSPRDNRWGQRFITRGIQPCPREAVVKQWGWKQAAWFPLWLGSSLCRRPSYLHRGPLCVYYTSPTSSHFLQPSSFPSILLFHSSFPSSLPPSFLATSPQGHSVQLALSAVPPSSPSPRGTCQTSSPCP